MNDETKPAPETESFSPLESMILEVLVARHQVGEPFWPFETNSHIMKALNKLERSNLINTMGGHVERTRRAQLTPLGKQLFMDSNYTTPGAREAKLVEHIESLKNEVRLMTVRIAELGRAW